MRRILLGLWLLLLATCATSSNSLPVWCPGMLGEQVIENEGKVCFRLFDNSVELEGYYQPSGCYSSSCTRPIEESLTVRVDTERSRIQFHTRFVLAQPGDPRVTGCTLDCGGAGSIQFEIGDVEPGTYSIWLGSEKLGAIDIPFRSLPGQYVCMESKRTPTPTPATVVPRPTARPTVTRPPVSTSVFHSPISPLPAPTATPTPLPSPTPTPQAAATPLPGLVWAKGVKPIIIERHTGQWSPTANEILLASCSGSVTDTVSLARAPDFVPIDLTPDRYTCSPPRKVHSMLWTLDGQHIVLVLPYETPQGVTISSGSAAVMDRQGDDIRAVNDAATLGRDLALHGWMNDHTLVYDHYGGGGWHRVQAIDIHTGDLVVDADITGAMDRIGSNHIGASTYDQPYLAAVAISRVAHTAGKDLQGDLSVLRFPADAAETERVSTDCRDWQPGTSNMLVLSTRQEPDQRFPGFSELMLWDVDTDVVSTLAPDDVSGRFAPDGRVLAYLTYGPAQLDAENRPIPRDDDLSEIVADLQHVIRYLQLLDLETGQVTLSLPTLDSRHFGYSLEYDEQARSTFSPDGRYLAFFTPGEIELDAQGQPVGVRYDPWQPGYLNVLDVSTGQVIRSMPGGGMLPEWSHDSSRLVYRDEQENLVVLDVSGGAMAPVTQSGGERVRNVHWSFDDRYLGLLIHDLGARPFGTAIQQVPLPVLGPSDSGLGIWVVRPTYSRESLQSFQVEYQTAKWRLIPRDMAYPVLVHRSLAYCWVQPDVGRGLPDICTIHKTRKELGDVTYEVTEVRSQEKLVSASYSTHTDDISTLFSVSLGEHKEMCIQDAEAVLATLRVVPAIDETGGQE